ncbi:LOW QUALITY PROTEIN: hypothetical protein MXB_5181 [Myxobolus squamalis]|nr:LOW QUALITY PROTEIN: hypothetical protein MXB_5181 [Myxobolus squamalis]
MPINQFIIVLMMKLNTAASLDEKRKRQRAYEYLCHLEEAKLWLEHALKKELPISSDLENHLRTGVDLALLASIIAPKECPKSRVYDSDLKRFGDRGLHFKHTDNIIICCSAIGFPSIFLPETLDLYEAKNTPKVIFCIHAFSHFLAKRGIMPLIKSVYGEAQFAEQEISKIARYFEKAGVKMPEFGKIGGMLEKELSENDAALHAANMLVSEAIDKQDSELLLERLKNPVINLARIRDHLGDSYLIHMKLRKDKKSEVEETKRKESFDEIDVYDKILSQTELQDCINAKNMEVVIKKINESLKSRNFEELGKALICEDLCLRGALPEYESKYSDFAQNFFERLGNHEIDLTVDDVESIIQAVNVDEEKTKIALTFVKKVEEYVKCQDVESLLYLLKYCPEEFCAIDTERRELVLSFLSDFLQIKGEFDRESLSSILQILSSLCEINTCIDLGDEKGTIAELKKPEMNITGLQEDAAMRYLLALVQRKQEKEVSLGIAKRDLLLHEVTACVDCVNLSIIDEMGRLDIVSKINDSLEDATPQEMFDLLSNPKGKFQDVNIINKKAYLQGLKHHRPQQLATDHAENRPSLWHNTIQSIIFEANLYMKQARSVISTIDTLNQTIISEDEQNLLHCVQNLCVTGVIPECKSAYYQSLSKLISERNIEKWNGWLDHNICNGQTRKLYYNHKSKEYVWNDAPLEFDPTCGYLNTRLVQEVCDRVGSDFNRELYFKNNLASIINIQRFYKTYFMRRSYKEHLNFINKELPSIILLQSYARTIRHRRNFVEFKRLCLEKQEEGLVLKCLGRTYIRRRNYTNKITQYQNFSEEIVNIQSLLRTCLCQNDFNNLINMKNPSLKQIYKYINILEPNENDLQEEKEINRLKNITHDYIRSVCDLDKDLKELDVTIGLLVKNRANLHDIQARTSKSKRHGKMSELKAYSKEKIELREKYGHIFYILRHVHIYFGKLLMFSSASQSFKLIKELVFQMFNFANTLLDEYHLVKTLMESLTTEIDKMLDSISQFTREDHVSLKIAISCWRDTKSYAFMQPMLGDYINQLLSIKGVITINVIEVYKQWISQTEATTGKSSELPFDVEPEKALAHEEVRNILEKNIEIVVARATLLRDSVINNREYIPYPIRVLSKVCYDCLSFKFPTATEDELLKVINNIIYYRFINPATVSPESFNLFTGKIEISTEQRKNLAIVSGIVQNAAATKAGEWVHSIYAPLAKFHKETYIKFSAFNKACIDVESPEQQYNINEFTDITQLGATVKLSIGQIIYTHKLLLEFSEYLFPTEKDILRTLLAEIGEIPKPVDFIDYNPSVIKPEKGALQPIENEDDIISSMIISLRISPPKLLLETEDNKNQEMLSSTITLIVDILHFSKCENIPQVLKSEFTEEQENEYKEMFYQRESAQTQKLKLAPSSSQSDDEPPGNIPSFSHGFKTLAETLECVNLNVKLLEESNQISSRADFSDILQLITKKILNRDQYVKNRKRDIARYRSTIEDLEIKQAILSKHLEYYKEYIQGCIANMGPKKKLKKKLVVKKTASKLYQSGILVEIEGISEDKFKNISFEFASTDNPGLFTVVGKLSGIKMDSFNLDFKYLLQLQFSNVHITKICDIVKVKVNLLIYFLNKQFHL